jgi:hypothetical protein
MQLAVDIAKVLTNLDLLTRLMQRQASRIILNFCNRAATARYQEVEKQLPD